jgi:membrane-bound lytic murein transglycosylase A
LNLPVTPRVTVAADPLFVPLGAPVFVDLDRNEADGLWVAQDTGGAIKGAVRADFYWGSGEEAGVLAGRMRQTGRLWVLLPVGFPL